MLYNPLKETMVRTIKLPVYYTGLQKQASVKDKNGIAKNYLINQNNEIELTCAIAPESYTWFTME